MSTHQQEGEIRRVPRVPQNSPFSGTLEPLASTTSNTMRQLIHLIPHRSSHATN